MKRSIVFLSALAFCGLVSAATPEGAFDCGMIKEKKVRLSCEQSKKKASPVDQKVADQQKFVEVAKDSIAKKMLDPSSVQFRNLTYVESALNKEGNPVRHGLCGEVNAKNSYGGYVGFKLFYVDAGSNYPDSLSGMVCNGDEMQKVCLMGVELHCMQAVKQRVELPNN